jgi:hypothetical protein
VTWRAPIVAPERIRISTRPVGIAGDAIVTAHRLFGMDDGVRAEAILVRRHEDVPADQLIAALR